MKENKVVIKTVAQKFDERFTSEYLSKNAMNAVEGIGYVQALCDFGLLTQDEFEQRHIHLMMTAIIFMQNM